jgi:triacylglycerol lipase
MYRRFRLRVSCCLLALLAVPPLTVAQHSAGPPSPEVLQVRAGVAALGRTWNAQVLDQTAKLYLPLHRQRPAAGIRQMGDVSYGPLARQKLDLFVPDQGFDELGPVIIFLHGGDATGGDKVLSGTDGLLYGNVARALARAGGIGINANYRAGSRGSAGAEDVRRVIEWTQQNAARYGGDPKSIIVLGHGEGAVHLASYLFDQAAQPKAGPGIAGAILSSATLGGRGSRPLQLVDDYQGAAVPILLWSAELDPVESGMPELKEKLCRRYGKCPAYDQLAGHNHISAVMSFDSADMSAMGSLIRFYHSVVRK